ncbi:hypothetical protein AMTR_s00026p00103800 [Amborella trichopoda]|uniref:Uncharacterized protein n=1 Tax=Amborella trichopoda TaxID=13333 RepID=W1PRA9_AMBTC|nr:hypothetical protein AMTR_s00026p00103800 [Amborella trichopoda]
MTPPGSKNHAPNVPPLDVVSSPTVPRSSSGFKALMMREMLCSSLQGLRGCPLSELRERMEVFRAFFASQRSVCPDGEIFDRLDMLLQDLSDWGIKALSCKNVVQASFERRLDALEKDLADRQGLVQQHAQEWAQLVSERDSLSTEVASLSGELEVVKVEMEELQAQVDSLSTHQDSSWEALYQRSCGLEQLDSNSATITSLVNLTA